MIADTNFILRAFDLENKDQGEVARRVVRGCRNSGKKISVFSGTILELAFTLSGKNAGYAYDHVQTAEVIDVVLSESAYWVEHREAIELAADFLRRYGFDMHDCFIAAVAKLSDEQVYSFDRDLKKLGVAVS